MACFTILCHETTVGCYRRSESERYPLNGSEPSRRSLSDRSMTTPVPGGREGRETLSPFMDRAMSGEASVELAE